MPLARLLHPFACLVWWREEVGRLERADTAVTKIQHNVNKPLADGAVQQLPSIWTTQAFHSFSDLEENSRMHTASTVKAQSSPATPRMPPGEAFCLLF